MGLTPPAQQSQLPSLESALISRHGPIARHLRSAPSEPGAFATRRLTLTHLTIGGAWKRAHGSENEDSKARHSPVTSSISYPWRPTGFGFLPKNSRRCCRSSY